jgi:glycosyltransferase involved in cell wall biosynthesis
MASSPAVAFFGYVFARTGYGTAARNYVYALHNAHVPMSIVNLGFHSPLKCIDPVVGHYWKRPLPPDIYLWHSEPIEFMKLAASPRLVALTTWETDLLPMQAVEALNRVGEVWVPSHYNLENFRRQLSVPVFQLPHALPEPVRSCFSRAETDRELGFEPGSFVFLATGTWQERKNLSAVVEAFLRAFPCDPDALLVLKTSFNFTPESYAHYQIAQAIARANPPDPEQAANRIRIFPLLWPEDVLASLNNRADCMLSLHRGEGWSYPLFEAAGQGTPIVATGYSGPMDFLDPIHHHLVDYRLVHPPADPGPGAHFPFLPGMQWAEPSVEHAVQLMRWVYENRAEARRMAAAAAPGLRERYSIASVGRMAIERLSQFASGSAESGSPHRIAAGQLLRSA